MLVPLFSKLKTTKSLKLQLIDIKANSSILMRLEMAGMAQNKQKCLIFIYLYALIMSRTRFRFWLNG